MTQEVSFEFFHSTLKIENLEEEGGVSHWENVVVKGPFFCRRGFILFVTVSPWEHIAVICPILEWLFVKLWVSYCLIPWSMKLVYLFTFGNDKRVRLYENHLRIIIIDLFLKVPRCIKWPLSPWPNLDSLANPCETWQCPKEGTSSCLAPSNIWMVTRYQRYSCSNKIELMPLLHGI